MGEEVSWFKQWGTSRQRLDNHHWWLSHLADAKDAHKSSIEGLTFDVVDLRNRVTQLELLVKELTKDKISS